MQQNGIIKIQKPPEDRGLWGKVVALFARLSKWLAGAVGKARNVQGTALVSAVKNKVLAPPANGGRPGSIKIKGPSAKRSGPGVGGRPGANPGPLPPTVTGGGIVVAATDIPKCNACKQELDDGRPKARCSRNKQHVIHSDCVEFMKFKCPYCGGRIAGYPRPAGGG